MRFVIVLIFLMPLLSGSQLAPTKTMSGVIDRYEGDQAVILLEAINEQIMIETSDLPVEVEAGTWVLIDDRQRDITIDYQKTTAEKAKVDILIRKLK